MDKKYYGTQECEVLAVIGEESVIELIMGEVVVNEGYGEESYAEPYHTKLIVHSSYISDRPVTAEAIMDEKKKVIRETMAEVRKMKQDTNAELRHEKLALQKEVKALVDKCEHYEGMSQYIDYLEGNIKYVIYEDSEYSFRGGIKEFDQLTCGCDSSELASVSFRSKRRQDINGKTQMYIGEYSDDSGAKYRVRGFNTLEEAISAYSEKVQSSEKITDTMIKVCEKFGIVLECVTAEKEAIERKKEESRKKEVEKLKANLKILEAGSVGIPADFNPSQP